MKTAVHFGAGSIGRGFLGQLYWQSGYATVFVDVVDAVVDALNARGAYEIAIVDEHAQTLTIDRVRAVHGRDLEAVAQAVAACDVASTAVGVGALGHVAAPLAAGLRLRAESGEPLNIVVCENLLDAPAVLRERVLDPLDGDAAAYVREKVGFVGSVVSRMVPVMSQDDLLRVAVEAYATLPVDATAFVGAPPVIEGMLPVSSIEAHEHRKLFCHNCGHALCAYAGYARGHTFIADAIADPAVRALVEAALAETGQALIAEHGFDPAEHQAHIDDLLRRFGNRALGDTVARVGRDPVRKLGRRDRLIGAALFCLDHDVDPRHVLEGVRLALAFDCPDDPEARRLQSLLRECGPDAVLAQICGLSPDEALASRIQDMMT